VDWVAQTLRHYPEIAILAALAIGLFVGPLKWGKFSLGNVTAVLLAGVLIGQLNITISPSVKSVFFLMFLFAVGYGVGPQSIQGVKRKERCSKCASPVGARIRSRELRNL